MTLLLFSENLFWHLLTFCIRYGTINTQKYWILFFVGNSYLPKIRAERIKMALLFFFSKSFHEIFWFLMSDIHENSKEQCIMGFVLKILVSICSFKVDPKITLSSFFSKSALQFYCFCICFFNNNRRLWLLKSPVHRFSFLFVLVSQKIVKWGKLGQ